MRFQFLKKNLIVTKKRDLNKHDFESLEKTGIVNSLNEMFVFAQMCAFHFVMHVKKSLKLLFDSISEKDKVERK